MDIEEYGGTMDEKKAGLLCGSRPERREGGIIADIWSIREGELLLMLFDLLTL